MEAQSLERRLTLTSLRRRWAFFAASCLLFLASGYVFLRAWWEPAYAARWLVLPSITIAYLLLVLGRHLETNHRPDESQLLLTFGWGNRLTLMRGVFVAAMLGFLLLPPPEGWLIWIPGLLYVLSDAADFFDGYLARITNHATRLGEILDMSFDGVGVLAAALLAVQYGQVPVWYLVVGSARYLYLGGLWLRRRFGKPVYDPPPSITRRVFAGLMMGFLAVALLPLFSPPGIHIAAALFGLPFLSGFARDWLVVSGLTQPVQRPSQKIRSALTRWLPVLLRLIILGLGLGSLTQWALNISDQGTASLVLGFTHAFLITLIGLGAAPRLAAILALCTLGIYQMVAPLSSTQIVLAEAYTAILFLGSGALSLWTPEEYLVHNRAGEPSVLTTESAG